jgi:Flp pilus assembly protein TadD
MIFPFRLRVAPVWGRCAAVLFCTLAATACVTNDGAGGARAEQPVVPGSTLSGNYLAARHAEATRSDGVAADFLLAALERSPDDPVLLNRAHNALLSDGRTKEAAAIARRYVAREHVYELPFITAAVDDIKIGRFADVKSHLMQDGPMAPTLGVILRAWALQGLGRTDEALATLAALKRDEGSAVLYDLHAALLNDAASRKVEAVAHARAAVARPGPPSLRTVQLAGAILTRGGKADEAEALYAAVADTYDDDEAAAALEVVRAKPTGRAHDMPVLATPAQGAAEALFQAASSLAREDMRDRALMVAELGLYLKPNFPMLQMFVGELLDAAGRLEDANRTYAAIDRASPMSQPARLYLAENLNRMDHFAEAEKELRAMVAERPKDPKPLLLLGDMLRQRERFADAVAVYDEAIALKEPLPARYWRVLYARGIALERAKMWNRAEADFLRALEFEPDQPLVLNYLGYSWVEQGENLDRAQEMIRRAVELRPNDGFIVDSLGWVYYRLGKYPDAVVQLERAVELQPEDPVINDHLGDAYWAVGRQREARFQWRAALDLSPEPRLRAELERKLQGVITEANARAR